MRGTLAWVVSAGPATKERPIRGPGPLPARSFQLTPISSESAELNYTTKPHTFLPPPPSGVLPSFPAPHPLS